MKIELKKIEHSERLSEETEAFSADLYIDGKKVGTASNRGHGGPTDYGADSKEYQELIRKAEAYCETLPPQKFTSGGEQYTIEMNLERYIDDLLYDHLKEKDVQKFRKKAERAMVKGFVIGVPDKEFVQIYFKVPLMEIYRQKGGDYLIGMVEKHVLPELKDGRILLNTNIPETVLKQAGLREGQYARPQLQETQRKAPAKGQRRKI
ncbi:hypothetical protein JHJ32_07700 [Parapedobacter sp. ISTM3]|uniref:hypothetical protein n=1 Tax=Parapedobacter sp. ISTM3 TaxID=2800130 RepID=UPI001908B3E5|nr:hypothetical protein [Parapedobacter sp. ISTM3]MBK1439862.1 hypothetical protein [Parapedobacter sp. ISTM3]